MSKRAFLEQWEVLADNLFDASACPRCIKRAARTWHAQCNIFRQLKMLADKLQLAAEPEEAERRDKRFKRLLEHYLQAIERDDYARAIERTCRRRRFRQTLCALNRKTMRTCDFSDGELIHEELL